ncbi:MAG: 4Fe-4S binding protein, partial [Gammaproteobacteria bacterium]|nr:4Fe-4S binding protein [Gammaproteobacteria bacterium]
MWFRKAKQAAEPCRYPGIATAMEGQAAALAVDSMSADSILLQASESMRELTGPMSCLLPANQAQIETNVELQHLPANLTGLCATGLRSSAFVDSMAGIADGLAGMAGKHLGPVIHLASGCRERQAWALHGSHDDYLSASRCGVVQLFARNVQEVADLSMIARRVAEMALIPVICAQDFHSTARSVQSLNLPEPELVRAYLGSPDDEIPAPGKAQEVLFGTHRRRVPRLLDIDNPAGIGGIQGQESYFRAVAAQHAFFTQPVASEITQAMQQFAQLTGRQYQPLATYKVDDAELVLLAMGAVVDQLCACVDHLRDSEGLRVGVVNLTQWRPFPGQALSHLLQGKRAVTVLESTDTPLAEDLPMLSEVRAALAKAGENASAKGQVLPHPGYAVFARNQPVPALYSAIYGVGTSMPSLADLAGVVKNMLPDGAGRRRAYVGVDFARVSRNYPHLQVLQQGLANAYPELDRMCIPPVVIKPPVSTGSLLRIHALTAEGGIEAGNIFARALAGGLGVLVKTQAQGGVESGLHPANLDIQYAVDYPAGNYQAADIMLVAGSALLHDIPEDAIRAEGSLVVSANQDPAQLWRGLPRRVSEWIKRKRLSVTLVDARAIAITAGGGPGHLDQLSIWALLGCSLTIIRPEESGQQPVIQHLEDLLKRLFQSDEGTAREILAVVERGAKEALPVNWEQWKDEVRPPESERKAPWSADAAGATPGNLFDPSRFWRSVGFLYDSGEEGETLLDPFLATGVIPARSSAHRDMSSYRLTLPLWLPENCTGCGLCWSHCPDSALPPTIQSVEAIIETGIRLCKADGQAMTQLSRIVGHLSAQTYKLVAKDQLHQYTMAGPLLAEAFAQLTNKMGLEGDALAAMSADFEQLHPRLEGWPIARTERYFAEAAKGEGRLLSIAVNPVNCKACGLCMAVCPDGAMTWETQTPERIERERVNLALHMHMPEVPVKDLAQFIKDDDLDSEMARLLNRSSYLSMVGGDSALPGHPGKTAVHLVSASVDSVMQQRYQDHVGYLRSLAERLKAKIQDLLSGVVQINDFDAFAARLRTLDKRNLDSQELANALGKTRLDEGLNQQRLDNLNTLRIKIEQQVDSFLAGRSRMVLAMQRGEITLWSGSYPDNPHASPWLSHARGQAPALAEGLFEGMSRRLVQELSVCRQVELELNDEYDPVLHSELANTLAWAELGEDERRLLAPVVMVAEAESVHWDDIDKVLASQRPITMLLLDRHGMAVGPDEASGSGLDYASRAMDLGNRFVLQGATGNPAHLIRGVVASLESAGPSLLRVYAPDSMDNALSGEYVAEDSSLALGSRAIPLFCFDPASKVKPLSLAGNPHPDTDWADLELDTRNTSGATEKLKTLLTPADWAVHQIRFRSHFTLLGKGHLSDDLRPLAQYLAMKPEQRSGLHPYIQLLDGKQKLIMARVSAQMSDACEQALVDWKALKARASGKAQAASEK